MSTNVIERALATSTVLSSEPDKIEAVMAERDRLKKLRGNLLPFEAGARESLDEQIALAEAEFMAITTAKAVDNLPMLDNAVFSWTKRQPRKQKRFGVEMIDVPALAFIAIDKEALLLGVENDGDTWVNGSSGHRGSELPQAVDAAYRKTLRKLKSIVPNWRQFQLSYSFPGVVPDEIRAAIAAEYEEVPNKFGGPSTRKLRRFDSLAFVCEVDRWETKEIVLPREDLDPILVGVKSEACFVIASFDPTTLESYIASEFTS